jgi:hypothetical protein
MAKPTTATFPANATVLESVEPSAAENAAQPPPKRPAGGDRISTAVADVQMPGRSDVRP